MRSLGDQLEVEAECDLVLDEVLAVLPVRAFGMPHAGRRGCSGARTVSRRYVLEDDLAAWLGTCAGGRVDRCPRVGIARHSPRPRSRKVLRCDWQRLRLPTLSVGQNEHCARRYSVRRLGASHKPPGVLPESAGTRPGSDIYFRVVL